MGGLISERDVARILGLSVGTLRNMRRDGRGPKFYRLGLRKLGYNPADVEDWLATRTNIAVPPPGTPVVIHPAVMAAA